MDVEIPMVMGSRDRGTWNPEYGIWNLEPGIRNLESGIRTPDGDRIT